MQFSPRRRGDHAAEAGSARRIFVGNYQITSKIATICEIEWPPFLTHVYYVFGKVFNVQIFALPGVACLRGETDTGFRGLT
jgi:hypothetical protein